MHSRSRCRFTRRLASAGGVYTYTAHGLGPAVGFIAGGLYSWAFAAGTSFVMVISGFFMNEVLAAHASIDLGWFAWVVILTVLLGMLALFDVRISTRMQLVVGVASVAAILLLLVIVLAKYVELAEPDATPARGAS